MTKLAKQIVAMQKHSAAKKLTKEEIKPFVDVDSNLQGFVDTNYNSLAKTRRAGFAAGLAQAQGKDVPFVLSNPNTAAFIGSGIGAATLGTAGSIIGKRLAQGSLNPSGGGPLGGLLGGTIGAVAGALLTSYLTRRATRKAINEYLASSDKVDPSKIDTSRSDEGRTFNLYGNPWYRGQAAAKAKLMGDKKNAEELMGSNGIGLAPLFGNMVSGPAGATLGNLALAYQGYKDGQPNPTNLI